MPTNQFTFVPFTQINKQTQSTNTSTNNYNVIYKIGGTEYLYKAIDANQDVFSYFFSICNPQGEKFDAQQSVMIPIQIKLQTSIH